MPNHQSYRNNSPDTPDTFDINKPVSSELDLDELFLKPVSLDFADEASVLDLTDEELLKYSDNHNHKVDEIYPKPKAQTVFGKSKLTKKVSLDKPEKAAQMPAVRAEKSSVRTNAPEFQQQRQKVNLAKPEKAAQMPAIRADGTQPPVIPWKSGRSGESNPNDSNFRKDTPPERQFLGRGTVNFAMDEKKNVILTAVSGVATLILMALSHRVISVLFEPNDSDYLEAVWTIIVFGVILFGFLANLVRSGEHWHYEATGREIIFSRRGRASYIIFYKDVLAVDYAPYKFLGLIESGYVVNVLAYGKRYEFRYVFPNPARKLPFDYTPFEIIRKQIDQLGINS